LRDKKYADENEDVGIEDQILSSYGVGVDPDDGKEK
jgi:hypothetical protein